jgi:isovaleryl-CoA dehydrogenase
MYNLLSLIYDHFRSPLSITGRTYLYNVARQLDLSTSGNGIDTDGVKLYCAPMAKTVCDRAIQVSKPYLYLASFI